MPNFSTRRDDLLVNITPPPPSARSTTPPAPPVANTSRTRGGLQNLLGQVEDRTLSHLEPSYSSSNKTARARIPSGGGNLDAFRNLRAAIARAQSSPPTTPHAPPPAQHQEEWDSYAPEPSTSRAKSAAVESWLSNSHSPQPSPPLPSTDRRSFLPPPTDLRSARGFPLPEGGRHASRSPEPEDPLPTDEDSPPTPPLRLPPGFGRREKDKTYEEEETPAPSYVRKSSAPPTHQPGHSLQAFLATHPQPSTPQPPHRTPSPPPSPVNQTTTSSPRRRTASAIKGKQRADLSMVARDESIYATPKVEYDESLAFRPSKQLRRSPSSSFAQPATQGGAPPPPTPARSNSKPRPTSHARPSPPPASSQSPQSRSTPRQSSRTHKSSPQEATRKAPTPFTTPGPSNATSTSEHFSTPAVSFTPSRSRITPRRSSTPPPLAASSPLKIVEDEELATEESDVPMSEDEASQPESLESSRSASPSPPHETTFLPDVTPSDPVEGVKSSSAETNDQPFSEADATGHTPELSEEEKEEGQEEEFDIVLLSPARQVQTTLRQSPSSARSIRSPSQTPTPHAPSSPLATVQTPAAARVRDVMRGAATPRAPGGWGWTPGGREKGKGRGVDEQVEEEVEEIVVLRRKKVDSPPVAQVQASIPPLSPAASTSVSVATPLTRRSPAARILVTPQSSHLRRLSFNLSPASSPATPSRLRIAHLRRQLDQVEAEEVVARERVDGVRKEVESVKWIKARRSIHKDEQGGTSAWVWWAAVVGVWWICLSIIHNFTSSPASSPYHPALYSPAFNPHSPLVQLTVTLPPSLSAFELPGKVRLGWSVLLGSMLGGGGADEWDGWDPSTGPW